MSRSWVQELSVSCSALHLRNAGHDVTLLDPRAPGTATSFGNAGGIVTGAVVPNSTPALRRNLFHILRDRDSPVRLRWSVPAETLALAAALPAGRPRCPRAPDRTGTAAALDARL